MALGDDTDELKSFVREHEELLKWVAEQRERQKRRDEMWRKVWESTLGNLVWAVVIGFGLITWEFVKTRLK